MINHTMTNHVTTQHEDNLCRQTIRCLRFSAGKGRHCNSPPSALLQLQLLHHHVLGSWSGECGQCRQCQCPSCLPASAQHRIHNLSLMTAFTTSSVNDVRSFLCCQLSVPNQALTCPQPRLLQLRSNNVLMLGHGQDQFASGHAYADRQHGPIMAYANLENLLQQSTTCTQHTMLR